MISCEETPTVKDVNSYPSSTVSVSENEATAPDPNSNNLSLLAQETVSSPVLVSAPAVNPEPDVSFGLSSIQDDITNLTADETPALPEVATSAALSDTPVLTDLSNAITSPKYQMFIFDYLFPFFCWVIIIYYFQYLIRGVSDMSPLEAAPSSVKSYTVSTEVILLCTWSNNFSFFPIVEMMHL